MADAGYEETEKLLKALEVRISKEYKKASEEAQEKLDDYLRRFEIKDKLKKKALDAKLITKKDYTEWRKQQIMVQERWTALRDELAEDYHNANKISKSIMKGYMPEVYAINHNYGTYQVERAAGVDTSYTLYNAETVERLMRDNPQLLPEPGKRVSEQIANGLDVRWNRQQIQSVMMQSILLGDSIPEIAHRLALKVGDSNHKAAIRNARTMTTGAQNAGRLDSYKRAEDMGVELEGQMWIATLDERTRHSHRNLDGEIQPIGHEFSNGCRYPGDPFGAPQEVWNCRCSTRAMVKGLESKSHYTRDLSATDSGDYEEWKKGHSKPNPIDLPEKKARAIKASYNREYQRYAKLDTTDKNKNGKMNTETQMYRKKTGKNKPMPAKQYRRIKEAFQSHGGLIISDDEALRRLKVDNAEGLTLNADTILLPKRPSRSAVFEELIHTAQYRTGLNDGSAEKCILCEIYAKEKLIKNSEAYNLTPKEVRETKMSLEQYKKELKDFRRKNR